jgi:mannitol/fructose-specific phosphotransferase system IIA component (Ntr-type)
MLYLPIEAIRIMNLKKALSPETVWVDLKADSKQGIIEEMVERLYLAGKIKDRGAVLEAVLDREAKMSTGMQHGVAIPHGKSDAVDSLVAAMGLNKSGVNFDSLDGSPCTIFFMTVSPTKGAGPHIQFLAEVSRLISQPANRELLLAAKTHSDIYDILTGK